MLGGCEFRIIFAEGVGGVEQPEAVFQADDTPGSIVDTSHGHTTLVDKLFEQSAEIEVVRIHRHIYTGVDGDFDGLLLVGGNMLAGIKIVDVCPVGHYHAVPPEVVFQPLGKQLVVGMNGSAVDRAAVHHHRQSSGLNAGTVWLKKLLSQIRGGNVCRCAVLACARRAVSEIMLNGSADVMRTYMVGILSLKALNLTCTHYGIDQRVFSEIFPHTAPAGISGEVDGRRISPRAIGRSGFIGGNFSRSEGNVGIERRSNVDILREQYSAQGVGGAMILVKAVDAGDADLFHRDILNLPDQWLPLLGSLCRRAAGGIEHRTDFVDSESFVELIRVEEKLVILPAHKRIYGQLGHLSYFLFECHTRKGGLDFRLQGGVRGQCRPGGLREVGRRSEH